MARNQERFGSEGIVVLTMLCGAFGSYVGIDLPSRPANRAIPRMPEEWNPGDTAQPVSAAGTFVASVAGFLQLD